MRELLRDPEMMARVLRRCALRAMVPAIKKLDRIARGGDRFSDDHERLACLALARLAPVVLAATIDQKDPWAPLWAELQKDPERMASFKRMYERVRKAEEQGIENPPVPRLTEGWLSRGD